MILLYSDGACLKKPRGMGGWAYRYEYKNSVYKDSGGIRNTTSNKMELLAAINGLRSILELGLEGKRVCVFSDSKYVVNGASLWINSWKRNGWLTSNNTPVLNQEFWNEIDYLNSMFKIKWKWIRGHNGYKYNEIVDRLARNAAIDLSHKFD